MAKKKKRKRRAEPIKLLKLAAVGVPTAFLLTHSGSAGFGSPLHQIQGGQYSAALQGFIDNAKELITTPKGLTSLVAAFGLSYASSLLGRRIKSVNLGIARIGL